MNKPSHRETLRQLLPTLNADDQAWLRQELLGWKTNAKLRESVHISVQELLAMESWLWEHHSNARTARERMSRLRSWCIYMLLRHGAMLPNEIFALSPTDMDWDNNRILVRNETGTRTVPLAPPVMRRLHKACDNAAFAADSQFLRCDDGFMRRSLQQVATACGVPTGLVNARSLRRHRAQELLQQGIPLPVVDIFLGRTANASNTLMRYNHEAAMELLHNHLQADRPLKSSARNIFQGRVTELESAGILVRVTLATASGVEVTTLITDVSRKRLQLEPGKLVNASVKAPWVLAEHTSKADMEQKDTLPENTYLAEVESVRDDGMVMEILARLEDGSQICALQSMDKRAQQPIQKGDSVRISFSTFAVILTI